MKKGFCVFLALVLTIMLCAVCFAEDLPGVSGTVDVPEAGLRFIPPEQFQNIAGRISMDGAVEITDGIYYVIWTYYAMTDEEISAWINNHDPDAPAEYRVCPSFSFSPSERA